MILLIEKTADAAAQRAADHIAAAVRGTSRFRLGAAAGRTFEPVYARLAALRDDLSSLQIVQLDEYIGIPRSHPAAFRNVLQRDLVEALALEAGSAALLDPSAIDPKAEIDAHARSARGGGGVDLQLLGLGLNGHLAFNEPGASPEASSRIAALTPETRQAAAPKFAPLAAPRRGMTLDMQDILSARALLLVVLGSEKAAVLATVLQGPETTEIPATFLRRHPAVTVVADAAAASAIKAVRVTG